MYIHVAGYIAVIAVLLACTQDKHDASYVFLDFTNSTGWSSDGVAWCVGLLPSLYAFFSLDTATHFCEEVKDAKTAIPRASKSNLGISIRSHRISTDMYLQ